MHKLYPTTRQNHIRTKHSYSDPENHDPKSKYPHLDSTLNPHPSRTKIKTYSYGPNENHQVKGNRNKEKNERDWCLVGRRSVGVQCSQEARGFAMKLVVAAGGAIRGGLGEGATGEGGKALLRLGSDSASSGSRWRIDLGKEVATKSRWVLGGTRNGL
ncbi:unnamed protein product [Sphenostylis stenocarpa]|uniref:Uncharacterized protein n=1 Tax=Sphenostylis stenocarpa TaxID=92480 RepID=A0AA86SDE6_9FABA|nr:unnamed protein product [Sphenostylis stenocarpa]